MTGIESARIEDHSNDVIRAFKTQMQRGLKAIGEKAVGYAKTPISNGGDMPVVTGRLMNSVDHEEDESAVYIGTNVEYAPVQENIHHFLKNAAANHGEEYKQIMETSLKT